MNITIKRGDSIKFIFQLYQEDGITPLNLAQVIAATFYLETDYINPLKVYTLDDINDPLRKFVKLDPLEEGKLRVILPPDDIYNNLLTPTIIRYRLKVETTNQSKVVQSGLIEVN